MITIDNLSVGQEDLFYITVNTGVDSINILLDGGNSGTRCKKQLEDNNIDKIDYIILTHIDQDHIKGLLEILKESNKYENAIIVYNKFVNGLISYSQAEEFEKLIEGYEIIVSYKEYQNNSGKIIFLSSSQREKLQKKDDLIYLTFLGPKKETVEKLYEDYKSYKSCKKSNSQIVNKSSIIFILEYKNLAILMTGDGYISEIIPYIDKLFEKTITTYPINELNLIKIPHHGSNENNKQLDELLNKTNCNTVIITNSNTGNVKIDAELLTMLKDSIVYVSEESFKYDGLNVQAKKTIEINNGDLQ